jgi:hypothetical protein
MEPINSNYLRQLETLTKQCYFDKNRKLIFDMAVDAIASLSKYDNVNLQWLIEHNIKDFWLWKITEAPGPGIRTKHYGQRFWSQEALSQVAGISQPKLRVKSWCNGNLREDHVITRNSIKDQLLNNLTSRENIKNILLQSYVCVVTKEEHDALDHEKDGWERYANLNIGIRDLVKQQDLSPKNLSSFKCTLFDFYE